MGFVVWVCDMVATEHEHHRNQIRTHEQLDSPSFVSKAILKKMLISLHSHPMEILGFRVLCHRLLDYVANQKVMA